VSQIGFQQLYIRSMGDLQSISSIMGTVPLLRSDSVNKLKHLTSSQCRVGWLLLCHFLILSLRSLYLAFGAVFTLHPQHYLHPEQRPNHHYSHSCVLTTLALRTILLVDRTVRSFSMQPQSQALTVLLT